MRQHFLSRQQEKLKRSSQSPSLRTSVARILIISSLAPFIAALLSTNDSARAIVGDTSGSKVASSNASVWNNVYSSGDTPLSASNFSAGIRITVRVTNGVVRLSSSLPSGDSAITANSQGGINTSTGTTEMDWWAQSASTGNQALRTLQVLASNSSDSPTVQLAAAPAAIRPSTANPDGQAQNGAAFSGFPNPVYVVESDSWFERVNRNSTTWIAARDAASSRTWLNFVPPRLASLETAEQSKTVRALLKGINSQVWLGAADDNSFVSGSSENSWRWLDGNAWGWTTRPTSDRTGRDVKGEWQSDEPNSDTQDCLQIDWSWSASGYWDDLDCNYSANYYVVEYGGAGSNNTGYLPRLTDSRSITFTNDSVNPTINITRSGTGALKIGQTDTITFTLSESSTNFDSTDVTVTGGTLSAFTGSGTNYSATFTPTFNATGTATVSVASSRFTDATGNSNTASSTLNITYDTVAPTMTITSTAISLASSATSTITFTANESITTFDATDVTVTLGTLTNFSGSGTTYTATFTASPSSGGTASISVASSRFTDAAGNNNSGSDTLNITVTNTVSSTGGRTSYVGNGANGANGTRYIVERFTTTGSTTWTVPQGVTNIDYLVIGGGGAGGTRHGGGGGAGGLRSSVASTGGGGTPESQLAVTPGSSLGVIVGAGGTNGSTATGSGTSGSNSQLGTIVSLGGARQFDSGGSGGGSQINSNPGNGTAGQGFGGGRGGGSAGDANTLYAGGGGGGAGAVGSSVGYTGGTAFGGAGGAGVTNSITGTATCYAGGGAGGYSDLATNVGTIAGGKCGSTTVGGSSPRGANATAGTTNTGSGGGGGGFDGGGTNYAGAAGGSGVVIIRYALPESSTPDLATGSDTGITTDNITTTRTLTFTGSAPAGASVQLSITAASTTTDTDSSTGLWTNTGSPCSADASTGAWSCTTTELAPGVYKVRSRATTILDGVTDTQTSASALVVDIDTTAPTVTLARSGSGTLKDGQTDTITFTLSEGSTNFDSTDINVTGGTLSAFTGSGTNYSATFTPTSNATGTATVSVASSRFTDTAANNNTASTTLNITYDTVRPQVSLSGCASSLAVGSSCTITITLSEDVADLQLDDFSVTRGTLSDLTSSGTTRTVTFTAAGAESTNATVSISADSFTGANGNQNTASNVLSISVTSSDSRKVITSPSSTGVTTAAGTSGSRRYVVHTFSAVGSTTWIAPQGVTTVDYLVLGGGGGGGNGWDSSGGGGGGAGMIRTSSMSVTPGIAYSVSVGSGGAGGESIRSTRNGNSGQQSEFDSIVATGGQGGGGSRGNVNGTTAGAGGAKQNDVTTSARGGNGGAGGGAGGGGGGASTNGQNASGTTRGIGGSGITSSITGTNVTYGTGGNGATNTTSIGAQGADNTGNGGNAGGAGSSTSAGGGNGGSGLVVLRYELPATSTPDLLASSDSGILDIDNITNNQTLTFTGSAAFGSVVQLSFAPQGTPISDNSWTSTGSPCLSDTNTGLWSCTTDELAPGDYAIRASTTVYLDDETFNETSTISLNFTIDDTSPEISSISITSDAGADNTYKIGDTVELSIGFSKDVYVTDTPRIPLVDLTNKFATYSSGSGRDELIFSYVIEEGDLNTEGLAISANSLELSSGSITDVAGNDAALDHLAISAQSSHQVDGIRPIVANVTSPDSDGIFGIGTSISIEVEFSSTVFVTGTPRLLMETGTVDRTATYATGSGTSTLTFAYTVQSGDRSEDLDYIDTTSLEPQSGSITDEVGNDANLTLPTPGAAGSLSANKSIIVQSEPTQIISERTPTGIASGAAFVTQPQLSLQDSGGSIVTTDNSTVVTATVSVGATLVGATTATAVNGVATFTDLGISGTAGTTYTITYSATVNGNALTVATQSVTPTVGTATRIAVTRQPIGDVAGALLATQPGVTVLDSGDNVVTDSTIEITVSASGGILGGTHTIEAVGGVASYTDLTFAGTASTNYTLTFETSDLDSITSNNFTVGVGSPTKLILTTNASGAVYGESFAVQPVVEVRDAGDNTVLTATNEITATLSNGTIPGTPDNAMTAIAINGIATFSNLGITGLPGNYTVTYSSGVLDTDSQSISLIKAGQTISFTTPVDRQWSAAPFLVSSTSSSGLNVTLTSTTSSICSTSGLNVTMLAVGTCSLTASQDGDEFYNAATSVSRDFEISLATQEPLIITTTQATFGQTLSLATSGGSGDGLVTYLKVSGDCTISGSTLTPSAAGSCEIAATKAADAYYMSISDTRTITIDRANQTTALTLSTTSVIYGQTLALSASGGNGDGDITYSVDQGTCSLNGATLTPGDAGSICSVRVTRATSTNYNELTSDPITITVVRVTPILGSFVIPSKTFGDPSFTLTDPTASYNSSSVAGSWSYSSSQGAVSTISNSTVTITGAGSSLITATFNPTDVVNFTTVSTTATLNVDRATPTFTWDDLSATYGDADISITPPTITSTSATGTWSYSSSDTTVIEIDGSQFDVRDVGTSLVTATFTPSNTTNFVSGGIITMVVTVNQADQANLFITSVTGTYGTDLTLVTTGGTTDGLITWTITNGSASDCVITSGKLTTTSIGTCTVSATMAGDDNYKSVTSAATTITIGAKSIIVTAEAKNKTYGDADPTFTYTTPDGALVDNDTLSGMLTRDSGENAGEYIIRRGSLTNTNYNISFTTSILTINPAPQSSLNITTSTITYRTPIELQASGGSEGDVTFSVVSSGSAVCSINNATLTATGNAGSTCTVVATREATNNYLEVTSPIRTITVSPRTVTLTATAKEKTYGDSDPGFTYVVTTGSLYSNDAFTGALTREVGENVGTYSINKGSLANPNYTIIYVPAELRITQRPITITAANKAKTFGESDPELTYTVTSGSVIDGDTFTGSITRAVGETLGLYNITQGTLDNGNYNINFVVGIFRITGAPQTGFVLTATSYSVVYQDTVALATTGGNGNGVVTYTAQDGTGSCSIVADVLTGDVTGTCTVIATKAAEGGYLEATSNVITITVDKADQSIAMSQMTDIDYSLTPITVSPTSDSGATVVIESRTPNVCTTTSLEVHIRDSGTCSIAATAPEGRNHNAAPTVVSTFEIRAVVPFAPTITDITPGNGTISVDFTTGPSGGASITTFAYSVNDGTTWTQWPDGSITPPLVIPNVPNSVEAKVRIAAVNRMGVGAQSNMKAATPKSPIWDIERKSNTAFSSSLEPSVPTLSSLLPPQPAIVRTTSVFGGNRTKVIARRASKDIDIPVTHAIITVRLKNGKLLARIQVRVDPNNPTTSVTVPYRSSRVRITVQFANDFGISGGGTSGANLREGSTLLGTTIDGRPRLAGTQISGGVRFAKGSSTLSTAAKAELKKALKIARSRGGLIYVTGYANKGELRSSWMLESLARKRAENVSKYLISLGARQWITFYGAPSTPTPWHGSRVGHVDIASVDPDQL